METQLPQSNFYEVRCETCDVSFAPATRRCLHCGGRLSSAAEPARRSLLRQALGDTPFESVETRQTHPAPLPDEGLEEDAISRKPGLSPLTGIWIALALGGAILNTCGR